MKKIAIVGLVVILAVSSLAFSQNKKGNWLFGTYIGGVSLGFGNSESNYPPSTALYKYKSSSFDIGVGPDIGYYLTDTLVLGAFLDLYFYSATSDSSYTGSTATGTDKYSYVGTNIGPFVRLYFGDNNGKGMPYVQFNAGIALYPLYSGTYTPSSGSAYTYKYDSYSSWNVGLQIGYEHYLNPFIGLQYYVGYSFSHYKYTTAYDYATGTDYTYTSSNGSHGIDFGVGLQIHLGGSK